MKNLKLYESFDLNEAKINDSKWKSISSNGIKFGKDLVVLYNKLASNEADKSKYKKVLKLIEKFPDIEKFIEEIQQEIFIADTKKF